MQSTGGIIDKARPKNSEQNWPPHHSVSYKLTPTVLEMNSCCQTKNVWKYTCTLQ